MRSVHHGYFFIIITIFNICPCISLVSPGNKPLTDSMLTQISDAIFHHWATMKLMWLSFTLCSFAQIHETNLWHPCHHFKKESLMILGMWGYRRKCMSMKLQQHNYHIYICCCQIGLCTRVSHFLRLRCVWYIMIIWPVEPIYGVICKNHSNVRRVFVYNECRITFLVRTGEEW